MSWLFALWFVLYCARQYKVFYFYWDHWWADQAFNLQPGRLIKLVFHEVSSYRGPALFCKDNDDRLEPEKGNIYSTKCCPNCWIWGKPGCWWKILITSTSLAGCLGQGAILLSAREMEPNETKRYFVVHPKCFPMGSLSEMREMRVGPTILVGSRTRLWLHVIT